MSRQRTVVEWSPHDSSLFAVGTDNLRLFETTFDSASNASTTHRKRSFRLLKINAQISQLKCLSWSPSSHCPSLIAAGVGAGKVVLTDFQDSAGNATAGELHPKYSRPCNAVAWNAAIPNQLAAGFEKVRSDFCTLVWDVQAATGTPPSAVPGLSVSAPSPGQYGSHASSSGDDLGTEFVGDPGEALDGSNSMTLAGPQRRPSAHSVMSNSAGGASPPRSRHDSSVHKRDSNDKPLYELSNSEATVALSWVPHQPTCLATGTGFKWLRIYDLRTKNSHSPLSVVAHTKSVLGVDFDRHRPHMVATYSDGHNEPIKVWDIRRLDSSAGPVLSLHPTSKTLTQVSWCPAKPGILITSSAEEKWVSLWDAGAETAFELDEDLEQEEVVGRRSAPTSDGAEEQETHKVKKPFRRRYTSGPLSSFSWQYVPRATETSAGWPPQEKHTDARAIAAAAFPNRLLTANLSGELEDMSVHDTIPIALSPLSDLGFSCGRVLFSGAMDAEQQQARMEKGALKRASTLQDAEDISRAMYSLAKQGYSMSVATNLKLFYASSERHRQLRSLWTWVEQVETLRRLAHSDTNLQALSGWRTSATALETCGVRDLLYAGDHAATSPRQKSRLSAGIESELCVDAVLGCCYYDGVGRRLALQACNWDPNCGRGNGEQEEEPASLRSSRASTSEDAIESERYELKSILRKCETEKSYARGAALAVFHGDLVAAVHLLQQGAAWLSQMQHLHVSVSAPYSSDVLQLVAMAVAGYSTASGASTSMWSGMCQQLLRREEILSPHQPRYLFALLTFLTVIKSSDSAFQTLSGRHASAKQPTVSMYAPLLSDTTLPLSDRLALACRYLPAEGLLTWVTQQQEDCEFIGRLDGLLVTGLGDSGRKLLQRYVDRGGDVQTLALLAARLPVAHVARTRAMWHWVEVYRDLLNQWQLFHERARFDVGRAQFENYLSSLDAPAEDDEQVTSDVTASLQPPTTLRIDPQLFARCNFCNTSLSLSNLLRQGGSHASWLNRTKPKLSCCPTCRKPLPQCALCLMPFGTLNPYFELAHRRSKHQADSIASSLTTQGNAGLEHDDGSSKTSQESLAQLSSIPFAEWFTWCQSCKHGGHAHHMSNWFESHRVCPVTDCECQCQNLDLPLARDRKRVEEKEATSPARVESATPRANHHRRHSSSGNELGQSSANRFASATMDSPALSNFRVGSSRAPEAASGSAHGGRRTGGLPSSASLGNKLDQLEKNPSAFSFGR